MTSFLQAHIFVGKKELLKLKAGNENAPPWYTVSVESEYSVDVTLPSQCKQASVVVEVMLLVLTITV
jgi:hypothetical protein